MAGDSKVEQARLWQRAQEREILGSVAVCLIGAGRDRLRAGDIKGQRLALEARAAVDELIEHLTEGKK